QARAAGVVEDISPPAGAAAAAASQSSASSFGGDAGANYSGASFNQSAATSSESGGL
ncbi:unnamed protein product, partial [Rotaria magnacalcarata]